MTVRSPSLQQAPAARARLRASPLRASPLSFDKLARTIHGCSAIAVGPALGHGMLVDRRTCELVVGLGAASPLQGIKCRFTHPDMCNDGLGSLVGHAFQWRLDDSDSEMAKARCDLVIAQSAKLSPKGDLAAYVMKLAEESPEDFAMSIVFSGPSNWKLDDGSEVATDDDSLKREDEDDYGSFTYYVRPDNAVGDEPFARPDALFATDLVEEPAANPDGLFARTFAAGSPTGQAFADLDALLERGGISLDRAAEFATRYLARRSQGRLRLSVVPRAPVAPAAPVALSAPVALAVAPPLPVPVSSTPIAGIPAPSPKGTSMKPEELKALKAKHPDHAGLIIDMFGEGKGEAEILSAIKDATATALQARVDSLTSDIALLKAGASAAGVAAAELTTKLAAANAQIKHFQEFGKLLDPGGAPGAGGVPATGAAAWKAEFASSPALQEEFGNDVDAYVAFMKNESPKKGGE